MKLLITGATGFVGKYVIREVKQIGEVILLGRKGEIVFDLTHQPTSRDRAKLPSSIDAVVHLAALTQKTKNDQVVTEEYNLQNVIGTKNFLTLLNEIKIGHFIYVSTLDVYGDTKGKPITEETIPAPQSPYAKSKYEAEQLCVTWTSRRGIPFCIARLGLVYGPGEEEYEKVIPQYIRGALSGQPLEVYGNGETLRDYIYCVDIARALKLLVEKKATGIYNIASSEAITIVDLAQRINKLTGNTSGVRFTQITGAQRNIRFDTTKLRHLGFIPKTSFEKGLSDEIAWFKKRL